MFNKIASFLNKNLTKKRIWIIGGATGYGASISSYFYQQGHDVIISSSNEKKIKDYCNKVTLSPEFIRPGFNTRAYHPRRFMSVLMNSGPFSSPT